MAAIASIAAVTPSPAQHTPANPSSATQAAPAPPSLAPALADRFSRGVAALQAGRLDEAETAFRDILRAGQAPAFVHHNLAIVLRERGRHADALVEFRAAAAIDPAFGPARLLAGSSLLALGRPRDAITELERAVRLMPRERLAHLQLADAYERAGDVPALVAQCRRIVQLAPDDPEQAYRLGRAYLALSVWTRERIRSIEPSSARLASPRPSASLDDDGMPAGGTLRVPERIATRADIERAIEAREWDRAERLLAAEIERVPDSPDLLTLLARIFTLDRKPLNAAVAIKKAEALGPIDHDTRFMLALAYISMKRGDWAVPELERLIASERRSGQAPSTGALYRYWLARIDYDAGRYEAAIARLQDVIARDRGFLRAYDNLGLCYEAQHQPELAIVQYREAIRLNRESGAKTPWPALNLAVLLRQRGEWQESEALLREALSYDPQFAQAHYELGTLLEERGRMADAIESLGRAIAANPSYAEPHYALSRIYRRQGQTERAESALAAFRQLRDAQGSAGDPQPASPEQQLREAIRRAPRDADAYLNLGRWYQEQAATDPAAAAKALDVYRQLLRVDAGNVEATYQAAMLNALAGAFAESRALLEGLDSRGLSTPATLRALGLLHLRQQRAGEARRVLERAVSAAGNHPDAGILMDLARAARSDNDRQGALGYLARARDLDPQNAGVHFFFGIVCVELNLGREAYESLKKAVALDPGNPSVNYALGAVAIHRHESSEALPYFEAYVRLRPDDPRGRFALGAARFYSNDLEAARVDLTQAAQHKETAAGAHYFLGRIARQLNDLPAARREVERSLQADPKYADAWAELGLVQIRGDQFADAERSLARALAIEPDNYAATLNLATLYSRTRDPRRDAQVARAKALQEKRDVEAQEFLRIIEVVP